MLAGRDILYSQRTRRISYSVVLWLSVASNANVDHLGSYLFHVLMLEWYKVLTGLLNTTRNSGLSIQIGKSKSAVSAAYLRRVVLHRVGCDKYCEGLHVRVCIFCDACTWRTLSCWC